MAQNSERFFILTGGPGAGKSALIEELRRHGYASTIEAGRGIIQHQIAIGGHALPWRDPVLFAEMMLTWEMRSYELAKHETGLVFFDRGVPDVAGYLRFMGLPIPEHVQKAVETFLYNRRVFIAPPWREIFRQDGERKQDFEEAIRTYDALVQTYREYGYQLVEIPRAPIPERVSFILQNIFKNADE